MDKVIKRDNKNRPIEFIKRSDHYYVTYDDEHNTETLKSSHGKNIFTQRDDKGRIIYRKTYNGLTYELWVKYKGENLHRVFKKECDNLLLMCKYVNMGNKSHNHNDELAAILTGFDKMDKIRIKSMAIRDKSGLQFYNRY